MQCPPALMKLTTINNNQQQSTSSNFQHQQQHKKGNGNRPWRTQATARMDPTLRLGKRSTPTRHHGRYFPWDGVEGKRESGTGAGTGTARVQVQLQVPAPRSAGTIPGPLTLPVNVQKPTVPLPSFSPGLPACIHSCFADPIRLPCSVLPSGATWSSTRT